MEKQKTIQRKEQSQSTNLAGGDVNTWWVRAWTPNSTARGQPHSPRERKWTCSARPGKVHSQGELQLQSGFRCESDSLCTAGWHGRRNPLQHLPHLGGTESGATWRRAYRGRWATLGKRRQNSHTSESPGSPYHSDWVARGPLQSHGQRDSQVQIPEKSGQWELRPVMRGFLRSWMRKHQ